MKAKRKPVVLGGPSGFFSSSFCYARVGIPHGSKAGLTSFLLRGSRVGTVTVSKKGHG